MRLCNFILFLLFNHCVSIAQLRFAVVGDTPYTPGGEKKLIRDIAANNCYSDADFLIHIGDIKSGGPCTEDKYLKVADILKKSTKPVFIIPGDNEWNDCLDPDKAWQFWEKHFMNFESNVAHSFSIKKQPNRNENFAFVYKQTLVIGINNVGGRIHDTLEWKTRLTDNADWIENMLEANKSEVKSAVIFSHAAPKTISNFSGRLASVAKAFGKPILYLQGDSHKWSFKQGWLASNITHIIIDEGAVNLPIVQIVLTGDSLNPVVYDRNAWSGKFVCNDLLIYPNPFNDHINIAYDTEETSRATITIKDLTGNTLYSEEVFIDQRPWAKEINISHFTKGVFFISLKTSTNTISKMIKKN